MSGFLDIMARSSRERVVDAWMREPMPRIRARALATPIPPPLRLDETFSLIAEYKRRSPSQGELASDDRLVEQVTAYADGGAAAVSVLTEPTRFRGILNDLAVAAATLRPKGIPVLRKDFLVDPYQLYEARAAGASGALLIVRLLSDAQLHEMLDCARSLNLFVLLESFGIDDIVRAASLAESRLAPERAAPVLLGVNCRDLNTLEVSAQRFREMATWLPDELPRVAESGIDTPDDCADVASQGYGLALVGGALMKSADPAAMIGTMLAAARAAARAAA
jgi:indole-3-glycerol phosphate synthase